MRPLPGTLRIVSVAFLCLIVMPQVATGGIASSKSVSSAHLSEMRIRSKPSSVTPWKPRPVLGPQNTLVLLVDFSNVRFRSSLRQIRTLVDTVDQWFRKSSYGKMYINYTIYEDVLTLPSTMSSYGAPEAGNERGDDSAEGQTYISDALDLVMSQTSLNLENYEHVVLVHAGGDEAVSGDPNDIWSHCDCVGPIADENPSQEASWVITDDSGRITHAFWGISTFSEDEHWAVFAHEYTHSLGVTDLYVYGADGYSAGPGVGFWSNMAAGAFLDPPADIDGWSKYILGWIDAVTVDSPQGEYTIYTLDSAKEPKALLVKISGDEDEYYFLHARRKAGADAGLPSEGVIVFKINRLLERSLEGEELALLYDANPDTPTDCSNYGGQGRELCEPLDAAYNEKGKQYQFSFYDLSESLLLNDDGCLDANTRTGFRVRPAGDDGFTITLGASAEEIGTTEACSAPVTTTGTAQTQTTTIAAPNCVIATAAFGSVMAPEVAYMRYVRDGLIGSTPSGRMLVEAFNAFYYSWSPPVARTVGSSSFLRAAFRILLLPVVLAVHAAALSFVAMLNMTGSADAAAVVAFVLAASICVVAYVVLPFAVGLRLIHVGKKLRLRCNLKYLHS
jgi:M6 family metalloprotease-like protein